jgi:hypothetical protein
MMGQSRIETSKKELTSKDGDHYKNGLQVVTSSTSSSNSNSFAESILIDIVTTVFYYTAWGAIKYGAIGDYKNEKHLLNNVTAYPYSGSVSGDYTSKDRLWNGNFRIDIEEAFLYNSNNLYGNHLKVKIRPTQLFYVQADARNLFEKNPIINSNYNLFLADLALCYDRIRFDRFNFGWKLGVSYVGNEVHKFGFAYGLNANYFIRNNISFSGSTKWSSINSCAVNSYELETKYHKKRGVYVFGYENSKIGTPTYNYIKLGAGFYF